MKRIYVVGTADTKGDELAFLAARIRDLGGEAFTVDVGTRNATVPVDVSAQEVAAHAVGGAEAVLGTDDRGAAVSAMGEAFEDYIARRDDIAGVIGIGGGGGTSIITAGMRVLRLGIPKVMVSTLASGDVSPYVDVSDIVMMPSVTDLAGLNRLSRIILQNAAAAISGMAANPAQSSSEDKPAIGLTMFGVTTPAVTKMVDLLKDDHDCLVFHATGTGGRSMENLARNGMLAGLLDITTTEICDLLVGGVLSAGEARMDAAVETALPYVGSVGALDMVNFWAMDTVPEKFRDRNLYKHNPNITLMRTTPKECVEIGHWIAAKLGRMTRPVRFLIPEKGVSALDIEGGAFFDAEADAALFETIETGVSWSSEKQLIKVPAHINDDAFAEAAVAAWREISA